MLAARGWSVRGGGWVVRSRDDDTEAVMVTVELRNNVGPTAVLIPVEGALSKCEKRDLAGMQAAVGGYVERVQLDARRCLLVDEDGLMKQLPLNPRASALAGRGLVGPAVLVQDDPAWVGGGDEAAEDDLEDLDDEEA